MKLRKKLEKIIIGILIAELAGSITKVLTSSRIGNKNVKKVPSSNSNALRASEERLKLLYTEISDLITSADEERPVSSDRNKEKFNETMIKAKDSKDKILTLINAIKNGTAQDKDLNIAIKETEKAITHIRDFWLKK